MGESHVWSGSSSDLSEEVGERSRATRTLWLAGLVSLFNDMASEMLYPMLLNFITQVLGAPVAVLGLIDGVAESSVALFKTLFERWSDRLGKRTSFPPTRPPHLDGVKNRDSPLTDLGRGVREPGTRPTGQERAHRRPRRPALRHLERGKSRLQSPGFPSAFCASTT